MRDVQERGFLDSCHCQCVGYSWVQLLRGCDEPCGQAQSLLCCGLMNCKHIFRVYSGFWHMLLAALTIHPAHQPYVSICMCELGGKTVRWPTARESPFSQLSGVSAASCSAIARRKRLCKHAKQNEVFAIDVSTSCKLQRSWCPTPTPATYQSCATPTTCRKRESSCSVCLELPSQPLTVSTTTLPPTRACRSDLS